MMPKATWDWLCEVCGTDAEFDFWMRVYELLAAGPPSDEAA